MENVAFVDIAILSVQPRVHRAETARLPQQHVIVTEILSIQRWKIMRNRFLLSLFLLALALYTGVQAAAQIRADKAFNDYEWYFIATGQNIPGTTLNYLGSKFSAMSDDDPIIAPQFLDTRTGREIDFGPFKENDVLQNNVIICEVIIDSNEFEMIGIAITVGVPRTERGTFADRLWFRMLHPGGD